MSIKSFSYRIGVLVAILAGSSLTSPAVLANEQVVQETETDAEVEAVPAAEAEAEAAQPGDILLYERPSYIGQCRSSGATLLTVYDDSSLTLPIDDIEPYTRITLTGVLGSGVAQIEEPLGWVRAATLLLNCDAGEPDPVGACYRVIPTAGLIARETPGGPAQTYQGQTDGPAGNSRVYGTVPPQRQTIAPYTWQRVTYTSLSGNQRLGWVAEARGTQSNLLACPGS